MLKSFIKTMAVCAFIWAGALAILQTRLAARLTRELAEARASLKDVVAELPKDEFVPDGTAITWSGDMWVLSKHLSGDRHVHQPRNNWSWCATGLQPRAPENRPFTQIAKPVPSPKKEARRETRPTLPKFRDIYYPPVTFDLDGGRSPASTYLLPASGYHLSRQDKSGCQRTDWLIATDEQPTRWFCLPKPDAQALLNNEADGGQIVLVRKGSGPWRAVDVHGRVK